MIIFTVPLRPDTITHTVAPPCFLYRRYRAKRELISMRGEMATLFEANQKEATPSGESEKLYTIGS